MTAYQVIVSFAFGLMAISVEAQTLIGESSIARVYRVMAAPGNTGYRVDNKTRVPLLCTLGWRNANGSHAQYSIGDSRSVYVPAGGSASVATGLLGTTYETSSCRTDPDYERAELKKRQDAAKREHAIAEQQQADQARQSAAQRATERAAEQQPEVDKRRSSQSTLSHQDVQRQAELQAAQARTIALADQQRRQETARQQRIRGDEDRQRRVDSAGAALLGLAQRMEERAAEARQRELDREEAPNEEWRRYQSALGESERSRLMAEREERERINALSVGVPLGKLPNGARDPNFAGFHVYQVRSGCVLRLWETSRDPTLKAEWSGGCSEGYLSGPGTLSMTTAFNTKTLESKVTGLMVKGAWDGMVDVKSKLVFGNEVEEREAERHFFKDGHHIARR